MSNVLTTKENIKDRLDITNTDFDELIDRLIVRVTARIETMANRSFNLATYTRELHDGSDLYGSRRSILITKNAPIGTITSVEYQTGINSNPNWVAFSQDDYDVDKDAGLLTFYVPLPQGKQNIRITYSAGWDGYDFALTDYWVFNVIPTGTVNGSNLTFTLPEAATDVVLYVDGVRELPSNVTHTSGETGVTLGRWPRSLLLDRR